VALKFNNLFILALYSTNAEGVQDTWSYSLLKTMSSGQNVLKVVGMKKIVHAPRLPLICSQLLF